MQIEELFNDPNYGLILCFLEKFRSILNLPIYPYQLLEKHLLNDQQIPARLIDFHFLLLKRLSRAKNARRENFETIISRFIARFDSNDSEQLTTHGYLQADIHLKLRILKNLLESQFDLNLQFQKTFSNQSSSEINLLPIGRDRFGVSYWLFIDNSYVRLFREDVDISRTWRIICRTRDELEKFIQLLLSDTVFHKKFSENIFKGSFSQVLPSNEFEQCYPPVSLTINENDEQICRSTRSRKRLRTSSIDEDNICLAQRLRKSSVIENPTKKSTHSRRRRRKRSSTSDDPSSDNDDDYLSEESTDPFFEFDDDSNESIQLARTAQTLTIIPNCFLCQTNTHPEVLLLCDHCNDAYHIDCLHPNLLSIPNHSWLCPLCEQKQLIENFISKYEQPVKIKTTFRRKIKAKQYSSDESLTATESESEELTLSSSSIVDDDQQVTEFNLQLPKQITRLIPRCDRTNTKNDPQQTKTSSIKINSFQSDSSDSIELNEKLGSPFVYVNSDGPVRHMKSVVTNSKQTSKIVRRWNDVQRRSRLKAMQMKNSLSEDLTDENSNFPIDDLPAIHSSNFEIKTDDNQLSILPSKHVSKKLDANFDRLTRDIQGAISDANVSSNKPIDQQSNKRNSTKFFSRFLSKATRSINISDNHSNIFKIDDCSLSNSISMSSSVDLTNDQSF